MHKLSTTSRIFYEIWLLPALWENVFIEEDYFDTWVVTILMKYLHKVVHFKAELKHEYVHNRPLNALLFSMYNLVTLDLSGCSLVRNFDFLQIMYQLEVLDVSDCTRMFAMSLVRSVNEMRSLCVFACRNNFISAFMIYQAVCGLDTVQVLDCSDSGFMHPYIARWLLNNCKAVRKFIFTSNFHHDDEIDKLEWYIVIHNRNPHIQFSKDVNERIDSYLTNSNIIKAWRDEHDGYFTVRNLLKGKMFQLFYYLNKQKIYICIVYTFNFEI